jgi:WD40 repeat protein
MSIQFPRKLPWVCLLLVTIPLTGAEAQDSPLPKAALAQLGKSLASHPNAGHSVAFSPDGKRIAWVGAAKDNFKTKVTIHLWEVAGIKEVGQHAFSAEEARATTPLVFSPDGKFLALATYHEEGGPAKSDRRSDSRIRLWEVKSGKELDRFPGLDAGLTSEYRSLAYAPGGKTLISVGCGETQVWDVATGKKQRTFPFTNEDEGGGVIYELLSPDGKTLATRLNNDPIRVWDVAQGKEVRKIKDGGGPLAFSADGKLLVSCDAGVIRLLDPATGKELKQLDGKTLQAAVSPDHKMVAWVSPDKTVYLFENAPGKKPRTLPDQAAVARGLVFSPNGKLLATAHSDSTVILWDVAKLLAANP